MVQSTLNLTPIASLIVSASFHFYISTLLMEVVRAQSVDVKNIMGCIFVVCIYGMYVRVYFCSRVYVYLCISAVFIFMECVQSERIQKQYSGLLTPHPEDNQRLRRIHLIKLSF